MGTATIYGKTDNALAGQTGLWPGYEENAAHFDETPYEPVRRVLWWLGENHADILTRHTWIEPCAGNGAIVRHVSRHYKERGERGPFGWIAVELRDQVDAIAASHGNVLVQSPCDIRDSFMHSGEFLGITNLPWYPETIDVVEAFWRKFPNSWLVALLCTQFNKDGVRPDWYDEHRPEYILRVGGRVAFRDTAEKPGGKYNHPVEWNVWRPRGEQGAGIFRVLSAKTCPQGPRETI